MTSMQPLKDEHLQLLPHIERLREVADAVGELSADQVADGVAEAHRFLSDHLIPHAVAEDAALYPVVGRIMGATMATATMTRDHVEVGRLTDELGRLRDRGVTDADAATVRRLLYGLYALVSVHFAKEEEIYVPLLEEALSPEEAHRMLDEMGHAAHSAQASEASHESGVSHGPQPAHA